MRSTPLTRKARLPRAAASPSSREQKALRDTGPSREVRRLVLERDGYSCVCCGTNIIGQLYSLLPRKRQSRSRDNSASNLITVLHACGERISFRLDPRDEARGYCLRPWDDPELVPVSLTLSTGSGVMAWLTRDGLLSFEPPPGA
jgi:hypothetical protein